LASLLGSTSCEVNSAHHQIIDRVPPGLRVAAQAEDGVIEALEGTGEGYLLSVQWHPEMEPDDPVSRAIFADFVRHALDFKTKKQYGGARTFL